MDDLIAVVFGITLIGLLAAGILAAGAVLLAVWVLLEGSALIYRCFCYLQRKVEHSKPTP